MFRHLFKHDDSHEFKPALTEIEESPVSPLGRTVFWLVACTFVFAVGWMFFGQVDVVVTARGIVVPEGNVKVMQPLQTGVIRQILVKPGDYVRQGETLMLIDPTTTEPEARSAEKNLQYLSLEAERIDAMVSRKSFVPQEQDSEGKLDSQAIAAQRQLYYAGVNALNSQLKVQEQALEKVDAKMSALEVQIEQNHTMLTTAEEKEKRLLPVLDIIAKEDYESVQKDLTTYTNEIRRLEYELSELHHEQNQIYREMSKIEADFERDLLAELSNKQKQMTDYQAKTEETAFINERQKIVSPVDGYVNELFIHTVGGVVTPAEKLISVVPADTPLLVKATVKNQDIGFIDEQMPVNLKVDTFSFQKYGMLKGQVKHIANDSKEDQREGQIYEVMITPLEDTLIVDGHPESLASGLSLTADIRVGKRRIIEFFVYPLIKYLNEGISVR